MSGHLIEQTAGGPFAHFFSGIIDGSELGIDDPGYNVVVKAYDSDVLRDTAAGFFQRLLEYGGAKIICYKYAIGSGVHVEYFPGGADGGAFAEVVDEEEGRIECQSVVCQGLLVAF